MLNFSSTPPADPRGVSLALVRTPPTKPFVAIVTSEDLIGTNTHFYHGRTLPHLENDCPACHDGFPFRWHAWVSCLTANDHVHCLFECTAKPAQTFVNYRKTHRTLRGCHFRSLRASRTTNGRVTIQTKPADLNAITLPKAPDLIACLSIIWNIPKGNLLVPNRHDDTPAIAVPSNQLLPKPNGFQVLAPPEPNVELPDPDLPPKLFDPPDYNQPRPNPTLRT